MNKIKNWFIKLSLIKKIIIIVIVLSLGFFGYSKISSSSKNKVSYETTKAEKGNLVVAVTGSGTVSSNNNSNVTTQATGVVKTLYVKDGDVVNTGDKILEIDLDLEGQQKNAQAWASYQGAQNSLQSAKDFLYTAQAELYTKWQTYFDLSESDKYMGSDDKPKTEERNNNKEFLITQDNWLAAEANFKLKEKAVDQARTSLTAAWYSYQQSSPIIYAPISGTVSGLSLQVGSVINSQSSSNTTATTNKIAGVRTDAMPMIAINLTEIDVPKIKVGDKATITFDAFSDKTYTGKVISLDLIGTIASGVTSYPTVILLDTKSDQILPNMATSANIITDTKDDVLLIPTSAVTTENGTSIVQVMKNGKPQTVEVEVGLSSDEQIEITSGLKEGDIVVTSTTQSEATSGSSTNRSTSPFGTFGGGGNLRIAR
ncbi:efflux RND transporter periplasmic adaptor subunit [Candidatus Roizmanbacteria bacterium]|nr:efflux RND transporter periplasmic adaptor subunit [Candidatus Roizmanbacteria bacterium]